MSLQQPTHPRPYLEPLEDRFLLSVAAPIVAPADHPPLVSGQYAAPSPVVAYPVLARLATSLAPATDRDGDDYLPLRGDDHSAEPGDAQHAEALALARSVAGHPEQQAGALTPLASPAPGTSPPMTVEVQPLVRGDDLPAAQPPSSRPVAALEFPGVTEAEGSGAIAPAPVVVVSAKTGPERDSEAAAPAAEAALLASKLAPEPGGPLAGLLPMDVQALRRNAGAFFARLGELVRGPAEGLPVRALAPWLLLGGAAAWEVVLLPHVLRCSGWAADPLLPGTEDEA